MAHVDFDMLTRTALGLDDMADNPFCQATLFNFRSRLLAHYRATGENLHETLKEQYGETEALPTTASSSTTASTR